MPAAVAHSLFSQIVAGLDRDESVGRHDHGCRKFCGTDRRRFQLDQPISCCAVFYTNGIFQLFDGFGAVMAREW